MGRRRRYTSSEAASCDTTHTGWLGGGGGGESEWRRLFTYLTRLLFVAVLLSSAVVIAASLLLLTRCRRAVKPLEGLVDGSHGLCSALGLPAYFACLVVAVTVFGLGCVGRRVSGLMLIGVSAAAAVVAVVLVMTHTCPTDHDDGGAATEDDERGEAEAVLTSLTTKLELCGLYPSPSFSASNDTEAGGGGGANGGGGGAGGGGWLYPVQFERFDVLAESSVLAACRDTVTGFNDLCGQHLPARLLVLSHQQRSAAGSSLAVNRTALRRCATHVAGTLRELCTRDSEVGFPILVTAPIFYIVVGAGLVYVQQAEERRSRCRGEKGGGGGGGCCAATTTASTNTETRRLSSPANGEPSSPPASPSRGRRVLAACLTSLCTGHSLCFTCLLRGHRCPSCCSSPSPSSTTLTTTHSLPSKVSFHLTEMRDGDGDGGAHRLKANGRVRTRSFSDSEEELHLIHDFV